MAEADVILKLVWFRGMADGPSVFGDGKEADASPALGAGAADAGSRRKAITPAWPCPTTRSE